MEEPVTPPELEARPNGGDEPPVTKVGDEPPVTKVTWDDAKMVTSFANVVNVLATREEVTLLLGTNQTWNASETHELIVQLSNRIVLTPYAAKRLLLLLAGRVQDYEGRYGPLQL